MALPHAAPGEIVDVRPLGDRLKQSVNTTLIKTDHTQVIRLVLPAGKAFPEHKVSGEITIQCLEGLLEVASPGRTQVLRAGDLLYLAGDDVHALKGLQDASALVTLLRTKKT